MLLRLVEFVTDWEAVLSGDVTADASNPPHWAVSSFAPSESDKSRISLYEVDEAVTAPDVAAALAFRKQTYGRWFFIGAARAALEGAGFELIPTKGLTHHPEVNDRHFEVAIPDVAALVRIAGLYLHGEPYNVEKKEIPPQLTRHARANRIDWMATAKGSNEPAWRTVRDFTKGGAVTVQGQPSA
jgi:hypothetical protein